MSATTELNQNNNSNKLISKQLRIKANELLNSRKHINNLTDIIKHFQESLDKNQPISSCLLTLEVIFTELLKRREMYIEIKPLKPKGKDFYLYYKFTSNIVQ